MIFSFVCRVVALKLLVILWLLLPNFIADNAVKLAFAGCFVYMCHLLGNFLDMLPRFRVTAKKKAVFITGCDSGFGYQLAHRLDSLGYKVFAGCLHPTGDGAQQLKNSTSSKLIVVPVDVTDDRSVQEAYTNVCTNLDGCKLWAVVNNAGIIIRGELEWTSLEDYKKEFEVNTFGVVRVTKAFLPLLRQSKGRVVTTTSFGGRWTFSGFAPYCMSKHATTSFCDGLRLEMEKFGVKVITVEPFSYRTSMTELDNILESADETWSKAADNLKLDYGEDYICAFKEAAKKFNNVSVNGNMHEVVDCLVEAVTCTNPHYSYSVGSTGGLILFWILSRMPPVIGKYIIRKYITFDYDISDYLTQKFSTSEVKKLS